MAYRRTARKSGGKKKAGRSARRMSRKAGRASRKGGLRRGSLSRRVKRGGFCPDEYNPNCPAL